MIIQNTSITIVYDKIDGIKKAYYNSEEALKEYFNEATVLPIPDDAPLDMPRIITTTHQEHAQLNISPISTTFEINYDKGFEKSWDNCSSYIFSRMTKVFEFLNKLTNDNYKYMGLITNILYDEIQKSGTQKITDTLLKPEKINGIHDINVKYTFIENTDFFVNIMIQNARIFKDDINPNIPGAFSESNQIMDSIGAVIDINDRCGFNINTNYKSDSKKLHHLVNTMNGVINERLTKLIEKGVY